MTENETLMRYYWALRAIRFLQLRLLGERHLADHDLISPLDFMMSDDFKVIRRFYTSTEKRRDRLQFFQVAAETATYMGRSYQEVARQAMRILVLEEMQHPGLRLVREGAELWLVRTRCYDWKKVKENGLETI